MATLSVTLKKSIIGHPEDQRATVRALGLRRIGHTVEKTDSPDIRGMVNKVRHLVAVTEKD
ncbi:MAG: 50S ribosomal protein L30 [Dehalococcoidia bacterium]